MFDIFKSTAMRRMLRARERVARKNPFFASILYGANLVESKKHKTIWSNGIDLLYNPDYVSNPDRDQFLEGELLHTVLHLALLHQPRKRWREDRQWNDSCDFPVNDVVNSYFPLAPDALTNKKYSQMAPEAIYEILPPQSPPPPQGGGGKKDKQDGKGQPQKGKGQPQDGEGEQDQDGSGEGQGNPDQDQNGEGNGNEGENERPGEMFNDGDTTPEEQEAGDRKWRNTVATAMEKSPPGTMPGNLQRLINTLFPREKIDWKDLIRDMSRDAKSNTVRNWSRPNRRTLGGDIMLPGQGNDQVFRLVMCLDVSGSVSQQMIQEMCEEAASLLDQNLVTHITLISVDTRIQNTLEAKSSEDLVGWNAGGGGGTDFRSAMDQVGGMNDVVGCIFLTDMMTSSFGNEPDFPVVWVDWSGGNAKAPYGRTVPYK